LLLARPQANRHGGAAIWTGSDHEAATDPFGVAAGRSQDVGRQIRRARAGIGDFDLDSTAGLDRRDDDFMKQRPIARRPRSRGGLARGGHERHDQGPHLIGIGDRGAASFDIDRDGDMLEASPPTILGHVGGNPGDDGAERGGILTSTDGKHVPWSGVTGRVMGGGHGNPFPLRNRSIMKCYGRAYTAP
jgi:hypothetical protein